MATQRTSQREQTHQNRPGEPGKMLTAGRPSGRSKNEWPKETHREVRRRKPAKSRSIKPFIELAGERRAQLQKRVDLHNALIEVLRHSATARKRQS